MIYLNAGRFEFCPWRITFTDTGEERVMYTEDRDGFETMVSNHGHIQILTVEAFDPTDEMKTRLEEVAEYPERMHGDLVAYIESGAFPEGKKHGLRELQLEKENEALQAALDALAMDVLMGGAL